MPKSRVETQHVWRRNRYAAGTKVFFNGRPNGGPRLGPDSEGRFSPLSIARFVGSGIQLFRSGSDPCESLFAPTPQTTLPQGGNHHGLGAAGMAMNQRLFARVPDRERGHPIRMRRAPGHSTGAVPMAAE